MEPRPINLRLLAMTDPVAALGILLGLDRLPFSMSMSGSFSTLAVGIGVPVVASLDEGSLSQRTWIENINYSLQVPNVFTNQIFKTQSDAALKLSPGIDVQLAVYGDPHYPISQGYVPLENLTNLIRSDRWPAGWPLYKQQVIQGLFQLTQAPGGAPSNQGPYNFKLTFNGWTFENRSVDNIDPSVAADKLREAGLLTLKPVSYP